jgi:hypothetical protein
MCLGEFTELDLGTLRIVDIYGSYWAHLGLQELKISAVLV